MTKIVTEADRLRLLHSEADENGKPLCKWFIGCLKPATTTRLLMLDQIPVCDDHQEDK